MGQKNTSEGIPSEPQNEIEPKDNKPEVGSDIVLSEIQEGSAEEIKGLVFKEDVEADFKSEPTLFNDIWGIYCECPDASLELKQAYESSPDAFEALTFEQICFLDKISDQNLRVLIQPVQKELIGQYLSTFCLCVDISVEEFLTELANNRLKFTNGQLTLNLPPQMVAQTEQTALPNNLHYLHGNDPQMTYSFLKTQKDIYGGDKMSFRLRPEELQAVLATQAIKNVNENRPNLSLQDNNGTGHILATQGEYDDVSNPEDRFPIIYIEAWDATSSMVGGSLMTTFFNLYRQNYVSKGTPLPIYCAVNEKVLQSFQKHLSDFSKKAGINFTIQRDGIYDGYDDLISGIFLVPEGTTVKTDVPEDLRDKLIHRNFATKKWEKVEEEK